MDRSGYCGSVIPGGRFETPDKAMGVDVAAPTPI
jgi:hypothetical protein